LSGAVEVFVVVDAELFLFALDHGLGDIGVGASETEDHLLVEVVFLVRVDDRFGEAVAAQDTSEDVYENGLHLFVVVEESESFFESFTLGTATDIEEVGWLSTVAVDDVHGGHSEAGTVDEASNVATDLDVVQVELFGVVLSCINLGEVLFSSEVLLAVGGVGIDGDLAISEDNLVVLGQDEWVDLNHIAVAGNEGLVDSGEDLYDLVGLALNTEVLGSLDEVISVEALGWVDLELEDLLWVGLSNVLDGHASSWTVDEGWAVGCSVKCERQVHFFDDLEFLNQVNGVTWEAVLATLLGDEVLAEHLSSNGLSLFWGVDEVHTSLEACLFEVSKSTAASHDLRLDNTTAGERFGSFASLFCGKGHLSKRDGAVVLVQECTCLVFVQLNATHRKRTVAKNGTVKSRKLLTEHHLKSWITFNFIMRIRFGSSSP